MDRITGRVDDEHGFSLTELLITVVIMGIIMAPLSNAMISFMRISDQTNQRLNESHDIQIAAAYFAQDVRSVGLRQPTYPFAAAPSAEFAPADSGAFPCGAAGPVVARLAWDDPVTLSGNERVIVAYLIRDVDGEKQLRRITCRGGIATPVSDIVVAHNVVSATAAEAVPGVITLALTIRDPGSTNPANNVEITLQGQRRQT